MRRRTLLATATTTSLALAGCVGSTQKPDVVTLTITSNAAYTGLLQAHGTNTELDTTGETTHDWTDDLPGTIRLTLYTGSRNDTTLTVTIHEDDEQTNEKTVTGANEQLNFVHTV